MWITAHGLRLDNEAVHIVVALRVGSEVGSRCGSMVDANGIHGLVSKHVPSQCGETSRPE